MKVITSILDKGNKTDLTNQINAVNSWEKLGCEVLAINTKSEIEKLHSFFPNIKFIEAKRTALKLHGKNSPYISDMLQILYDNSVENEVCAIINSDIYLKFINSTESISDLFKENPHLLVCMHRYDIESKNEISGEYYFSGIDVFFMLREQLLYFTDEGYAIGLPEWDHWMVYKANKIGLQILEIKNAFAFHVKHEQRWTAKKSNTMGNLKRGEAEGEEYYYITNTILSDISKRKMIDIKLPDKAIYSNSKKIILEENWKAMAIEEMSRLNTEGITVPLGWGYYKETLFYRICNMHNKVISDSNINIFTNKKAELTSSGITIAYKDIMQEEFIHSLDKFYIYPAGRAARILLDGLLYYNKIPLGFIDKDENLKNTEYLTIPIYGVDKLDKHNEYNNVIIVSNLYVDEIYQDLSNIVPREKLIVL